MRPTANFLRHIPNRVKRNLVAILRTKQSHRALLLRLFHRRHLLRHVNPLLNPFIHKFLDFRNLLRRHLLRPRKIKTQPLRRNVGPLLQRRRPQHLMQRRMQQMRRRVHPRHNLAIILQTRLERTRTRRPRQFLVLAIRLVKPFLVHNKPRLRRHLQRHLKRKTKCVIQLERRLPTNLILPMRLQLLRDLVEHRLALIQRLIEPILLRLQIKPTLRQICRELRIHMIVLLANHLRELHREPGRNPQKPTVPHRTPNQTPQHIIRPNIPRLHPTLRIAQNKRRRPHVVRNNPPRLQRHFRVLRLHRRHLINRRHNRRKNLRVIHRRRATHHAHRPLNTHPRVHIVPPKRHKLPLRRLVVLHEHIVPNLNVLPTMTTRTTILTTRLLVRINEHLRIRPARPRCPRRTPPVVLTRQRENVTLWQTLLLPKFNRLVIPRNPILTRKHRHIQIRRIKPQLRRQKFKAPSNRLRLEIIIQRPVPQHLKERQMCRVPHFINVARPHALLHVRQTLPRRMLLRTHQIRHQRMHPRRRKQHRRIILRNDRCPRDNLVSLRFKKRQI